MKPTWIGILALVVVAAGVFLSKLSTSVTPLTREQLKLSAPEPVRLRPKEPKVRPRRLSTARAIPPPGLQRGMARCKS